MSRKRTILGLGTLLLGGIGVGVSIYRDHRSGLDLPPGAEPLSAETLTSSEEFEIDVTPRKLASIPPGTMIDDRPPAGWSHLIVKSQPRVGEETKDAISEPLARLAGLLFTAVVADVKQDAQGASAPGNYYLAEVAIGVGTDVHGRQIVLSPQTQEELGADLGFMERRTLAGGEEQLQQMRCMARSRTMAVLDSPNVLLRGQKHRRAIFRYLILVDPATGRLDTLLWTLESPADGQAPEAVGPVQWLPPNKLQDAVLHVDTSEFTAGIVPNAMGFALVQIPQGWRTLDLPEEWKSLVSQSPLTPDSARALQERLREMLSQARSATGRLPSPDDQQ